MGIMFDKLPYKKELQNWIALYGSYSNVSKDEKPASLEHLMRFWEKEKTDLYKMLEENFIFEQEIDFNCSFREIKTSLQSTPGITDFINAYYDWLYKEQPFNFQIRENLFNLVTWETLGKNEYQGNSFKITINDTTIAIQRGCKPSRILGKIANAANIEGFERFRIAHSVVLDKKSKKGTLCISIHPLDYITMSDNEYDWDSCMNWRDKGCYRMGTVEMMNSPCVVVVYLKGDKEMRYLDYKWNSKKWRNLFIVTPDFITGIKGYPYQNTELDTIALKILKDLAEKNLGYNYNDKIYEHHFDDASESFEITVGNNWFKTYEVDFNFDTEYMYNDFGNNNITHFILNPKVFNSEKALRCMYSGVPECMFCGEIIDGYSYTIEDANEVICTKHFNNLYCVACGEAIDYEYELDGEYYCETCYFEYRRFDPFEGEYHHEENMEIIYMVPTQEEFEAHKNDEKYLLNCPHVMVNDRYYLERRNMSYDKDRDVIKQATFEKYNTYWNYKTNITYQYVVETDLAEPIIQTIKDYSEGYFD